MKLLEEIRNYYKKPYPYYYKNAKFSITALIVIFLLSFSFSYFFEPFEVNPDEHKIPYIWISIVHAFIPVPIAFTYFFMLNKFVEDELSWTIGKEMLCLSVLLFVIGIFSFLVRDYIYTNPDNWSLKYFLEEIRNTFLVGILLLSIILPINLERLYRKYSDSSQKLFVKSNEAKEESRISIIESIATNTKVELNISDFLFAEVESNYTEIVLKSRDSFEKKLIRIPLKELEHQLSSFRFVYRTHRSYLVNINYIEKVEGNAQGYKLTLTDYPSKVPVSRSKIENFDKLFS